MWASGSFLLCLLAAISLAPSLVGSCSCPDESVTTSRMDAIRDDFTSSITNIYIGMVVAATCNCIPGNEATPTGGITSNLLNCQFYQLETSQSIINATLLSQGQCDNEEYSTENHPPLPVCSLLGNTLMTWGLMVEGPVPPPAEERGESMLVDLTSDQSCRYACPFNVVSSTEDYSSQQPCFYTVRVREVFKGNYSANEELEVSGPDVLTTCGDATRRLQISSQYVIGIGGACSPITSWSVLSTYSVEEMDFLRTLSREGVTGSGMTCRASLVLLLLLSLLVLWS